MKKWNRLLCLLLMVFAVGIANAQNVAKVGSTEYATLKETITNADAGATIELLEDVDLSSEVKGTNRLPISKSLTINGNNHVITMGGRGFSVGMNASSKIDVTFKDLTINNASSDARCIDTRGNIGTLTLEGVTLNTQGASGTTQPLTIGGNQSDAATVNITNSTIQTNDAGTAYYAIITFNPVNMTISNSTLKGWACIYAKGENNSAGSAGSTFTIDNSTIVSSNAYSGVSNAFAAFIIEDNNVKVDVTNSEVTITNTGDQIQSIGGTQINSGLSNAVVNLGEGNNVTFVEPGNYALGTNQAEVKVNGGTFNVPLPDEILPEGYICKDNGDGTFTVKEGSYVAQITETKYETLEDAFAAAKDGETITMLADVTLSGNLELALDGKSVTLDLDTKTLNGRTNLKSGNLTVKNGTVNCEGGQPLNVYGSATAGAENYSVLTVAEDVTVSGDYGVCMFGPTASAKAGYGAVVNIAGTLNGTKGTVFVSGNLGNNIDGDMNNVINITGKIYGNNDAGVALNGNATVNVKRGAEITGNTGIAVKRGVLNVEDGATVHATGAENLTPGANNNGTEMTGAAISMTDTYNNYGAMSVNITGGTFTSDKTVALFKKEANYTNDATYSVSGGTFSTAVPAEFCAPGYEPKDLGNGQYSVYAPTYEVAIKSVTPKAESWYISCNANIQFVITKDGQAIATKPLNQEQLDKWDIILDENYLTLKSKAAAAKWLQYNFNVVGAGTTTIVFQNKANPEIKVEQEVSISHKLILTIQPAGTHMVEAGPVEIATNTKFDGVAIENFKDFTFTSSDGSIATISGTTITPLKAGTITVTATKNDDQTASASAKVTFVDAPAKIGEVYYESIGKAMEAAQSGETITLLRDVTESYSFTGNQPRTNDFALTIDLNGYTWSGSAKPYTLRVDYGTITIKDSQSGGGVKYGSDYAFIVSHLASEYPSKLILENGTFTGKTSVAQVGYPGGSGSNKKYYGGDLVVNGGTFVTVPDEGETYDENSNFKYTLNMLDMVESSYPGGIYSPSTITVNGGKFLKFDPQNNLAEGANTNFVAEGLISTKSVEDGEAWYTITEAVAQIGETYYGSLAAAVAVAGTEATTIKMIADETLAENVVIGGTYGDSPRKTVAINPQSITLDLNGHKIGGDKTLYLAGGSLNIIGEGTVETTGDGVAPVGVRYVKSAEGFDYTSKRTLSIGENVTVKGADYGLNIFGTNDGTVANDIEVNVNGKVEGTLFVLGNLKNTENNIVVNVKGSITSTTDAGIALNGNAKVNVAEGASVTGLSGIEVRAGELNVSGGTIKATAEEYSYKANGSGTTTKGAAIAVAQHNTILPATVTVNSGTLEGTKAIAVVDVNNNLLEKITVSAKDELVANNTEIPAGFKWISNEGMSTLTAKEYVAQIGDTKYETLQEAVNAAGTSAATITLLTESATDGVVTGNGVKVQDGQNITFDLNGLTYNVDKTVGSAGTETNGFQLLKGSTVKFTNGTVTSNTAQILLQNYSDLTLDGVTVNAGSADYAVSNNFGSLTVTGETNINAKNGGCAFDLWYGMSSVYDEGIKVTFDEGFTGKVTGKIEYGHANRITDGDWQQKASLEIKAGNFDIDYAEGSMGALDGANIVVSGGSFLHEVPAAYCAEGMVCVNTDDDRYTVKTKEAAGLFDLKDGETYTRTEDVQAAKVTYTRSFSKNVTDHYQCWYVPFEYTIKDEDAENFQFYKIHMISASGAESGAEVDDNTKVFVHIEKIGAGTVMKANRPYVVVAKKVLTDYVFTAENVTLYGQNTGSRLHLGSAEYYYDFYGTYVNPALNNSEAHTWISLNTRGELFWNKENSSVRSYRWYIKRSANNDNGDYSKQRFIFVEDDEATTGVRTANADSNLEVEGIYTVGGVKVEKPVKGVNIIRYTNGKTKKIYIK